MSAEKRRALAGRIMKLLSIVAAMLMYPVLSKDEVHHLRGEQEQANQDAIGVPEKELADTKGRGDAPQADEVGVPTEEVKPNPEDSEEPEEPGPLEGKWDEFDEADEEPLGEFMPRSFVAYRPYRPYRPYHPYHPYHPYPRGGGCRRWVTCYHGYYRGIRCSGGRYCTLWR